MFLRSSRSRPPYLHFSRYSAASSRLSPLSAAIPNMPVFETLPSMPPGFSTSGCAGLVLVVQGGLALTGRLEYSYGTVSRMMIWTPSCISVL